MELTPVTFADLATFPGAAMAAMIVVAFAGALFSIQAAAKRITSIVVATAFYLASVLYATPEVTFPIVLVGVISGMLAGMAAAQLYDNLASGFDHRVVKQPDV